MIDAPANRKLERPPFPIDEVWIEEDALTEPLCIDLLDRLPERIPVLGGDRWGANRRAVEISADPLRKGKRILKLARHRGAFIKPCPGTRDYICCGLQILHIGQGCPMDCRYCALQAYFDRPVIEVFVNREDLFGQLGEHFAREPSRVHRICTGEFTDSLALEPLTGLSRDLVRFFSTQPNGLLELKTKTDFVDSLLDLDPRGRVVVSFSVNPAELVSREEIRAASLERRLAAAAQAQASGYRLGFHFDPIIPFPGWQDAYKETVDAIFSAVHASRIAWISLGVIRFVTELKEIVRMRFPGVRFIHDGFIRGFDGKYRLPMQRRVKIYRTLADRIRRHCCETRIYLCMESSYVWKNALGLGLRSDNDLHAYLDEAVVQADSSGRSGAWDS